MSVSLETLALAKKYAKNNIPSSAEPIVTDKTLSVLGAPADAKITGDRLNEVETDFFDLKEALRVNLLELLSNAAYTEDDMSQYYNDLATALGEEILVGITAVFNQGANKVYATNGLDSLKQYLTVSARYSDGTSATLQNSDYTLSGTLSDGVSTITVSYDDSTATFDVTVSAIVVDSVTAVFDKGSNNVYPGDELESLKQYLTVTAHYSDNSSSVVQGIDYTLSGTLAGGTSTITVSFNGKTTTFDVVVESVSLDYIGAAFNKGSYKVYPSDNIDSLKRYLTVTAYYSDGTTSIVPSVDYTLYGELVEGANTVTVLYSSKVATFNVDVSPNEFGLLHEWDFTESLVDKRQLVVATLGTGEAQDMPGKSEGTTPPVRSSAGVTFNDAQQYLRLLDPNVYTANTYLLDKRVEIDVASFEFASNVTSDYGIRFLMVADPENPKNTGYNLFTSGLVYAQQGISDDVNPGWKMKVDTTGEGQISGNTFDTGALSENIDVISGTTISIDFYTNTTGDGIVEEVYFPYDEDLYDLDYESSINIFPRTMKGLQIGSGAREQYGGCFYNAVITGVRIYDKNVYNGLSNLTIKLSQGENVVHTTDSIDSLKQYIKVMATYKNGYTCELDEDRYVITTGGDTGLVEPYTNIEVEYINYLGYTEPIDNSEDCRIIVGDDSVISGINRIYYDDTAVHVTDTLDSLRAHLNVWVILTDYTNIKLSENDYRLSGTLAEGTSTITVSYRGHTATVDVEVVA